MKKEELIEKTNRIISSLVYEKTALKKAYNYYNCKRDKDLFKYLEDNFGIGNPTAVEFIPLIRKHVDALVGEYLNVPILPKVSCKDTKTIQNIFREKQVKISTELSKLLQKNLKNNLLRILGSKDMVDLNIKELLDNLVEDINENFISEYEIAGQNIVEYIILSRNIDLVTKLKQLYIDLLVTGFAFFRVLPSSSGKNIQVECLNPLDTFPELNYNSPYIRDCLKIVIRKYLNRNQILSKYKKLLTKEDKEKIGDLWRDYVDSVGTYYVRSSEPTTAMDSGKQVVPLWDSDNHHLYTNDLIPVYEVEWIETDKDGIENRYSTIRIGSEIYILKGKDENVIRSLDCPEKAYLTVNGVWFNNRGSEPYSMVLNCMVLQDKFDLLHFYRDNLIASSGSVGDFINLPTLPTILGNDLSERLMKWKAYAKQGMKIIDTSQEGQVNSGLAPINTMFNGFDDTVKVAAIQAIQLAMDSVELTTSSITGVFRERLNGIQQRDAVTNVLTGINNSFTITKQWHFSMDLLVREILLGSIDCAKIVYSDGLTGTLILGDKLLKVFTALPKYYTVTDFDVHIITSTEVLKLMELIKAIVPEFIKGEQLPPEILMDIITAKSLSDMKMLVKLGIKKQQAKMDLIQQLTKQLEESQGQLQQVSQQLQEAQSKIELLNEAKMQLEQLKMQLEYKINDYNAKTERAFKESQAENDSKRTEIELLQLHDGNPYNDEVVNV